MNLTAIAQATLLLTCHFSAGQAHEHQPLSLAEWGRLALWLRHQRMSPADLLTPEVGIRLVAWQDPKIPVTRIIGLLARGHSLALALDKWQRAGLWVVTRADEDYPCRLKATLKNDSPPVIFGCGNRALLQSGGLAVFAEGGPAEVAVVMVPCGARPAVHCFFQWDVQGISFGL